jgi:hypothetical protein
MDDEIEYGDDDSDDDSMMTLMNSDLDQLDKDSENKSDDGKYYTI